MPSPRPSFALALLAVLGLLVLPSRIPAPSRPAGEPGPAQAGPLPWGMTAKQYAIVQAKGEGRPRPDHPDEFHRILTDMRTRPGRTEPDYAPGYRTRELTQARARSAAFGLRSAPLPWIERGPGNIAGRARGLIVDPDDASANTWYVGSVGGGVWKTTDAGAGWQLLTPDLPSLAVSAIAMAGSNHDVLYAGTGESFYNIDTVNGDGMYKSTDRGATWSVLSSTTDDPNFNNVARIVVDPADENVVLAATTTGRYKESIAPESQIMKSTDGGTTWTEVFVETDIGSANRAKKVQQIVATSVTPSASAGPERAAAFGKLYGAVDEKGILVSTDNGDSWSYSNSGITDFSGRFELAVSPVDPNVVFAAAEGSSHSELWVSTDAGGTWHETFENGSEPNWLGSQGWYDNTILCDPNDASIVYLGGIWPWMSDVDLTLFTRTTTFLTSTVHADQHNLVLLQSGGLWRILNANDGGVAVSASMTSGFTRPINGMNTSQFYGVDKRPGASAYIGGMQDNGTWRSPVDAAAADLWTFQIGGDGYETSWHFNDPQLIIGGYQYNGIQRSTDGGATWNDATSGGLGSDSGPFITKIAKSNQDPDLLFAVGGQGVWRSTDFGLNWSVTPLSPPNWLLNSFCDVKISRANPDVVWAGAYIDASGRINVSTDGGLSFSPASNATPVPMGLISGLATHPTDDQTAYVLFSYAQAPKILRTTDQGASWTDISGFGTGTTSTNGFPDVAVYDLLVRPDDPNILWAGTEIGLVESTDGGGTWHLADNGLPAVTVWAMTHVEDEVVVATHGRGIWSVSIPAMVAGQTFSPLLEKVTQAPTGLMQILTNLRSDYDSTQVLIDGGVYTTLPASTAGDTPTVEVPVVASATRTVQLRSYRSGTPHLSPLKSISVYLFSSPAYEYANDFNTPTSDFVGTGFTIGADPGFSSDAIHSPHFYPDGTTSTYTLTVPITVASDVPFVEYDDVALVEPGNTGSVYGDADFYDFVVVEGTLDGCTWLPIADGYDARFDPAWLTRYNSSGSGDSALLRHHMVDLTNTFAPGDTILLRFRLYADGFVNGWGWAIDNLEIQAGTITGAPLVSTAGLSLAQNSPNPFRNGTSIRFALPQEGPVNLRVYDVTGRLVRTLVHGTLPAGTHDVRFERAGTAAGVYFYKLEAAGQSRSRKMVVLQ